MFKFKFCQSSDWQNLASLARLLYAVLSYYCTFALIPHLSPVCTVIRRKEACRQWQLSLYLSASLWAIHKHIYITLYCFRSALLFMRFWMASACLFVNFTAWLFRLKAWSNPVFSPRCWWILSLSTALNCQRRKNASTEKGFKPSYYYSC